MQEGARVPVTAFALEKELAHLVWFHLRDGALCPVSLIGENPWLVYFCVLGKIHWWEKRKSLPMAMAWKTPWRIEWMAMMERLVDSTTKKEEDLVMETSSFYGLIGRIILKYHREVVVEGERVESRQRLFVMLLGSKLPLDEAKHAPDPKRRQTTYLYGDCVLTKLNENGPDHGSLFKKRIAEFADLPFKETLIDWTARHMRAHIQILARKPPRYGRLGYNGYGNLRKELRYVMKLHRCLTIFKDFPEMFNANEFPGCVLGPGFESVMDSRFATLVSAMLFCAPQHAADLIKHIWPKHEFRNYNEYQHSYVRIDELAACRAELNLPF